MKRDSWAGCVDFADIRDTIGDIESIEYLSRDAMVGLNLQISTLVKRLLCEADPDELLVQSNTLHSMGVTLARSSTYCVLGRAWTNLASTLSDVATRLGEPTREEVHSRWLTIDERCHVRSQDLEPGDFIVGVGFVTKKEKRDDSIVVEYTPISESLTVGRWEFPFGVWLPVTLPKQGDTVLGDNVRGERWVAKISSVLDTIVLLTDEYGKRLWVNVDELEFIEPNVFSFNE